MKKSLMSYDELNDAISYSPETGSTVWKIDSGKNIKAGTPAGCVKTVHVSSGEERKYLYITYKGQSMIASRVVWLLHYGEWPENTVQFIDGDSTNLRISNLKQAEFPSKKVSKNGVTVRKMSKEAQRHYGLKRHYGITLTEYAEKHKSQDGKCAICGQPETTMLHGKVRDLSVDHCHTTGKIRELLCNACNHILGEAKENKETLLAAVAYLEKHSAEG